MEEELQKGGFTHKITEQIKVFWVSNLQFYKHYPVDGKFYVKTVGLGPLAPPL
jgi:hypothetical protein